MARYFTNMVSLFFLAVVLVSLCACDLIEDLFGDPQPEVENAVVNRAQPQRAVVDSEEISLDNCGGSGSLTQSLGSEAAIRRGVTIGRIRSVRGGYSVSIPEVAEAFLESKVEDTYHDEFEVTSRQLDTVEMVATAGTHSVYEIAWQQISYASTVGFTWDGENMEADYSFVMNVPRVADSRPEICPTQTPDNGEEEPTSDWKSARGNWNFGDDRIFAQGSIGFNKAYITEWNIDDLTYEVTLRKTSNNDGPIGAMIRYDETDDTGYLLLVWPHGAYQFSALVGEERRMIASDDPSNVINRGNEWNTVTITAVGPQITLSINNSEVASFTDRTFSSGTVGLVIHGDSEQSAEFENPLVTER